MDTTLWLLLGLILGVCLGALIGALWVGGRRANAEQVAERLDQAELMQSLDRLSDQVHELDLSRATWQGEFRTQVESLRRETATLSTALRRPQVRGRWGEMHLRRAVELAGLVDRCDFVEQMPLAEGALRPDLVVTLAGGRNLVVDAKVPLDAFLDATGAEDEQERAEHLARHARQVRGHIDQLGAKRYWAALAESPEFVVLFLPGESFLAAVLQADSGLLEYSANKSVLLATPTSLITLLRTVAHGWQHETLAAQARQVQSLGQELHGRLGVLAAHLDKVGRSLDTAVRSYNSAVGSFDTRVLVSARKFTELGVPAEEVVAPRQVERSARSVPTEAPPARAEPGEPARAEPDADEQLPLPEADLLRHPAARRTRGA